MTANNSLVMLGRCTLTEAIIIGTLQDKTIVASSQLIQNFELSKTTSDNTQQFLQALLDTNLQLNPVTMGLEAKYIPAFNEKILYHSYDFQTNGIGIVRDINSDTQEVELYCYFTYPTKTAKSKLGYSMHERNIVNLRDYIFEPLLEDSNNNDNRFSPDDGISAYRRLKRELEKAGKIWRDKLRRIEPTGYRLKKGEPYWYIDDKLRVIKTFEKDTPTSNKRFLCGNYFLTNEAALIMLNKFYTLINDYLASSQWPNIDND